MCKYNANEILDKINELPETEAMDILSNFTMLNLMQILNHTDVYEEYIKNLNENIQQLTNISNGLSKLYTQINTHETGSH